MEVTYTMSRVDLWRCNLYILFHRPATTISFFLAPIMGAGLIVSLIAKDAHAFPSAGTVFLTATLTLAAYATLQALVMYGLIRSKLPHSDSQRLCTTGISPDGVRDITPEQNQLLAWYDVKGIRINQGDVYFWKRSAGIIVPRGAFKSFDEANEYYQAALDYWRHHAVQEGASDTSSYIYSATLDEQGNNGETVLWRGNPDPKAQSRQTFRTTVILTLGLMIPFSVIFLVFAGLQVWSAILGIWSFVLMILLIPLLVEPAYTRKIQYTVTDKTVRCTVHPSLESHSSGAVELAQVERIKYWKLPDGVGSLEIASATESVRFDTIANAAKVLALIANARGRPAENIDALFAQRSNSDPFTSVLHQGECIVWQGQPARALYLKDFWGWKGGIAAYPVAAFLIVLAEAVFSQSYPLLEQIALLFPFVLIGGWLVSLRQDACVREASQTFYAVTTERLLMLKKSEPGFFAEADLAPVKSMLRRNRLALYPMTNPLTFGDINERDFAFGYLADPDEVRKVILAA